MDPLLSTSNHLAVLQYRAKAEGSVSIFKIPKPIHSEASAMEWSNITIAQLAANVNTVAHFLTTELKAKGVPPRSVVSLWWTNLLVSLKNSFNSFVTGLAD